MRREGIEKLCPFSRTTGIGQISRDQDRVERLLRVDLLQSRQGLPEPPVPSRAGSPALDPALSGRLLSRPALPRRKKPITIAPITITAIIIALIIDVTITIPAITENLTLCG